MPRTKPPRVVIPRKTVEAVELCEYVKGAVEMHSVYGAMGTDPSSALETNRLVLDDNQSDMQAHMEEWQTKLQEAKAAKAQVDVYLAESMDAVRNIRDLGFTLFQPNPADVVQFGFEIYTSPQDGGGDGTPPPDGGGGGEDDPPVV